MCEASVNTRSLKQLYSAQTYVLLANSMRRSLLSVSWLKALKKAYTLLWVYYRDIQVCLVKPDTSVARKVSGLQRFREIKTKQSWGFFFLFFVLKCMWRDSIPWPRKLEANILLIGRMLVFPVRCSDNRNLGCRDDLGYVRNRVPLSIMT